MKQYLDLFKALSDETRLRIIVLLSEKELCVCQIETALKLPQVKISRHLTILRYTGLVKDRREGLWIYYSLAKPKNEIENVLFDCFRKYLHKENSFSDDLANMKKCTSQPLELIAEKARSL